MLQVLVMAAALSAFFFLVGRRGVMLVLLVALPSLLCPALIWLRTRQGTGRGQQTGSS